MKGSRAPALLLILLLSAGACRSPEKTAGTWSEWRQVDNAYAERFAIWQRNEDRLVLVFGHGGAQDTIGAYWISGKAPGVEPPVSCVRLDARLNAVAVGSTTHVPYIGLLGHSRAIKACAHMDQVRDTLFAKRAAGGMVKEIATGDGLDRETLLMLRPQALFVYPFGRAETSSLGELGIPSIEVSEYLEEHPLGRAEWLRFFGVLFGEEHKADSLFAGIRERYETIRADSSLLDPPTVLFGSVWQGQWWVPPGNSYMARLIEDAGGRYVFADLKGEGNIAIDMETMVSTASNADLWGMIAQLETTPSVNDFTNGDQRLMSFRSVKEQRLFLGNTRVSDLFGQALLEPDIVLADLRNILVPPGCILVPMGWLPPYFRQINDPPPTPGIRTERFEVVQ